MKKNYNILGNRKIFLIIAAAVLLIGLLFNLIFGTKLDISFKGGTLLTYSYTGEIDADAVKDFASDTVGKDFSVNLSTSADMTIIKLTLADNLTLEESTKLQTALTEQFKANELTDKGSNTLPPTMGKMFFVKCLVAIALAAVLLLVYIAFRFRKIGGWSAAVVAILALIHDMLVSYFAFIIFRIPLDANFVAVELTILGYSLNGTIVIFDRIRENRRIMDKKATISEVVNTSINQTMTRSINTTITTFLAVSVIGVIALIVNLDSLISLALPMAIGILAGFYSSTFLSCSCWALWMEKRLAAGKSITGKKKK